MCIAEDPKKTNADPKPIETEAPKTAANAKATVTATIVESSGEKKETATTSVDKPQRDADAIPLFDGSHVYVSKMALARAFITMPAIYTSRVTDLVIGKEKLAKIAQGKEAPDKELLQAIITHVCQVFAIRGDPLTPSVVQDFIDYKISTLKVLVVKMGQ